MVATNVRELGRNRLLLDLGFRDTEGLVASYLLPLPDSGWAVIETGPASCRELLARGLDRAGISRDQVRQVFVTHIHLDHAGGMGVVAEMFPQATLYAHALGVPHMIDPSKLDPRARVGPGARPRTRSGDPSFRSRRIGSSRSTGASGSRWRAESSRSIDTPGHAKHHLALFDTGTQGLCSGDGAGVRLEGSSRARPAVPPPDLDVELLVQSVERMRALAPRTIYYSHFGPSSGGAEELQEYVRTVRAWTDRALAAARTTPSEPVIADALRAYEKETRDQQGVKVGEGDSGELVSGYDLAAKGFLRYFRTHGLIPAESIGTAAGPEHRQRASGVLLLARTVYAFNWYNVGAVLPLIGSGLHVGAADLGIILGTFLVGVGIFQIPAGFAAMHWGARKVSLAGLLIMGVACVASAFSPTWEWLAGLRFFAGVGAAFFFSPALSLIASYYPTGARGPVIGLYNGSFSIGGAIGLSGGVLIGQEFGWAAALLIGGIAMLGTTGIGWLLLPRFREEEALRTLAALWSGSRGILRSRSIWALSLGLVGFWAAIYVVAQYFVEYASVDHPAWGGIVAGSLAGLVDDPLVPRRSGGRLVGGARTREALAHDPLRGGHRHLGALDPVHSPLGPVAPVRRARLRRRDGVRHPVPGALVPSGVPGSWVGVGCGPGQLRAGIDRERYLDPIRGACRHRGILPQLGPPRRADDRPSPDPSPGLAYPGSGSGTDRAGGGLRPVRDRVLAF